MSEKYIELEKRIAFQEDTIADLNAELIDQQKRIRVLEKQVRSLVEHSRGGGEFVRELKDETPPPHY